MGDELNHSLINPNQLRHYGVTVQDNPFHGDEVHIATEDEELFIPLTSSGTTIFANTRTPTPKELQESTHVHLTSKAPWNPHDVCFPEPTRLVEEGRMANRIGKLQCRKRSADELCDECFDIYNTDKLVERLIAEVRVEETMNDVPTRRTFVLNERHSQVNASELSDRWCIGLAQATNTIRVTTQKGIRSAILPLSRRYRADRVFERPLLRGRFYTDTLDARTKSLDGNRYAQIFANQDFFAMAPNGAQIVRWGRPETVRARLGRPEKLTFDGAADQCGKKTEFMKTVRKYSVDYHVTEPFRPNYNFAESVIREIRKKWCRIMVRQRVPRRPWNYGLRRVCDIQNRTANSSRGLGGKCPLEKMTGESVDISEYLDFGFYDRVWLVQRERGSR